MTELPDELDYHWGGDGSDLLEPVRAHVEAALAPTDAPYPPPLDKLLELGDPDESDVGEALDTLGLSQEHVPDLVRMARDRALNIAPSDSVEVWAPIHALRALESLDVDAVADELIALFDIDSEWFGEGLADVFANAGAGALESLGRYIQDTTRWISGRNYAIEAFGSLAERHPELRDRAVEILGGALERAAENDEGTNGFLIGELIDLAAVEQLPLIRQAFERGAVDESIVGDWAEVLEQLGETPDPTDPLVARSRAARSARHAAMFGGARPDYQAPPPSRSAPLAPKKSATNKQKTKRKLSKASRKANKSKKKRK